MTRSIVTVNPRYSQYIKIFFFYYVPRLPSVSSFKWPSLPSRTGNSFDVSTPAVTAEPTTPTTPNNNNSVIHFNTSKDVSLVEVKVSQPSTSALKHLIIRAEEEESRRIASVLRRKYESLGPVSFAELTSGLSFVTLIVLWVLRQPGFVAGWSKFFSV